LIYYMLSNKEVIKLYNKKNPYISNENYRKLAREINMYYKDYGNIEIADLMTYFKDNETILKTINELLKLNKKEDLNIEEINDYINLLKAKTIDDQIKEIQGNIKNENDINKKTEMLQKIIEYKKMKNGEENND